MMKPLNMVSEMFGVGDYEDRRAVVELCNGVYSVALYKNKKYTRDIVLPGKSLSYAEDTAENYCLGIVDKEFE